MNDVRCFGQPRSVQSRSLVAVTSAMKRATLLLVLVMSLLFKASVGLCAPKEWPKIQEFTAKVGIETSAEQIFFEFPLIDVHGQTRYRLICVGGSTQYLDRLAVSSGANIVGPLPCGLVEGNSNIEGSLLSEDDSAYWYSRGQIHNFRELTGSCAKYPEYGALRHFRLRGFELTLSFGDVQVDKAGNPTYFTLTVLLRRDARITSPQAEQTGYLTPYKVGASCNEVRKGNERRMCRDSGGSWTECDKLKR